MEAQKSVLRHATQEEMRAIRDLINKAMKDVHTAISTPLDLVRDVAGISGIWAMTLRLGGTMIMGSAMSFAAMRDGQDSVKKADVPSDQDILFCALLAAVGESQAFKGNDTFDAAQVMFEKIMGYKHQGPQGWKEAARYEHQR